MTKDILNIDDSIQMDNAMDWNRCWQKCTKGLFAPKICNIIWLKRKNKRFSIKNQTKYYIYFIIYVKPLKSIEKTNNSETPITN